MKVQARWVLVALSLALACGTAVAKERVQKIVYADNKAEFADQAAKVRKDMSDGGRYEFIKDNERTTVEQRLAEIGALLEKHPNADEMSKEDKTTLLSAQEEINGILTQRDSKRLICDRKAPTGSHLPQTSCITYGESQRQHQDAERMMMDSRMKASQKGGN